MRTTRRLSAVRGIAVSLFFAALLLAGCRNDPTVGGPGPADISVVGAYTMLAPSANDTMMAFARVVVDDGTPCPTLGGGAITTVARAKPQHPSYFSQKFPVTVCEADVPFGQALTVDGTAITLGAVKKNPTRIFVYGDTGCKHGTCGSNPAHPFDELATAGDTASTPPDLILHMGDFNYRGTGYFSVDGNPVYDAGDTDRSDPQCQLQKPYISQNADSLALADSLANWINDFFSPAFGLLSKAPWVFARGNHELCSRAGPGWFYFLGPGSDNLPNAVPQVSCPDQGSLANPDTNVFSHLAFAEPYALRLDTLRLLVLDSANACDGYAANTEMTNRYKDQFETLAATVTDTTTTWIMTHRPIWGLEKYNGDIDTMNTMMQTALAETSSGKLPSAVKLSLAGHQHNYESLTFPASSGRPPQIVIGNSGVGLSSSELDCDFTHPIDGQQADGNAGKGCDTCTNTYGFLNIGYQANGSWTGSLGNPAKGTVVATCNSANLPGPICTLAPAYYSDYCPASSQPSS